MKECSSASDQEEDAVYSDNEYCDDDIYIAKAVVAATARSRNRRRAPQPMHNSRLTGTMRAEEILNGHEEIILGLISMKSDTFRELSHLLGYLCVKGRIHKTTRLHNGSTFDSGEFGQI
ncbi:hypothetical protein TIFTF001_040050 [Ficus carica]|uniref:Uncharacterized protein n=1 Tax=Ficus carica TaxID=3494 RepID=A0AA88CXT5_FICCA|nr:hypothetical protein TIFTF001_040050 [Ficus carica]